MQRLRLLRQLRQDFGGDVLAAVASIPDNPSPQQVKELKTFARLLANELALVGSLSEDRAALPEALQQELPAGAPWLRQVECRIGQDIEQAVRKILKDRPYVVLQPEDVEVLKKLFEPQALAAALDRVAAAVSALPPGSAEALRLQEDPLGIAELAGETLQKRLAARRRELAGSDPEGFFLSPDGSTLAVLGRAVLPATNSAFDTALLAAAQRAANRAIAAFREQNPSLTVPPPLAGGGRGRATLRATFAGMSAVPVPNRPAGSGIGLLGGALACVLACAVTGRVIGHHNVYHILHRRLEKRGLRAACQATGVLVLAAGVLFIAYGPAPDPETVAGERFYPEFGNPGTVKGEARAPGVLRGRGVGGVCVMVVAPDEDRAYAAAEEVERRLQPFLERGELSPGSSILDVVPSAHRQQETIAALKSFDFTAAGKAFKAAAMQRFGAKASRFEPFLERLKQYGLLTREPAPLTLAAVMSTPLAGLLAPYVKLDAGLVRLASSWSPARPDMPAQWYEDVARTLEADTPQGVEVRVTSARMVGLEMQRSLVRDCAWVLLLVGLAAMLSLAAALRSLHAALLGLVPLVYAGLAILDGVLLCRLLCWDSALISLCTAAFFGYTGALFGALAVLPALPRLGCKPDSGGTEKQLR